MSQTRAAEAAPTLRPSQWWAPLTTAAVLLIGAAVMVAGSGWLPTGDAALLAHAFVLRFASEYKRPAMTLLPDALNAIEHHPWPGNVRQLENVVKRAVIMAEGASIGAADLELATTEADEQVLNLRVVREEAERAAVLKAMGRANGNLSKAAEWLGVSRPTLYDLMHRYGLK